MRINDLEFSVEVLREVTALSLDKADFAKHLGFTFTNGKVYKKLEEIITEYNLDVSHFDSKAKNKNKRKYPVVKKNCPICGDEFETQAGHRKEKITCSYECSNVYFSESRHTQQANLKRSEALRKSLDTNRVLVIKNNLVKSVLLYDLVCKFCQKSFKSRKKKQKHCSQNCAAKSSWQNPIYRNDLISQVNERVAKGLHKGWSSRLKLQPSFPEKTVLEILNEINVIYLEREYKVGKYFIDFADVNRKIAIEIDGGQHELPERKIKDQEKDSYLTSQGWSVKRIKWKKLNKEVRKELVEKIINILL